MICAKRDGHGLDKAVSHEHAQERTHQRATNHGTQNGRRLVNRVHGFHHTQHASHNTQGGQAHRPKWPKQFGLSGHRGGGF